MGNKTPLQVAARTLADMKQRCLNPRHPQFKNYGARGITICDRWMRSSLAFLDDVGPRPAGTSIDRIDNEGNYEPGNVRWATPAEQRVNQRTVVLLEHNGEKRPLRHWAKVYGLSEMTVGLRLRRGWSVDEALTIPPNADKSLRGSSGCRIRWAAIAARGRG